MIATTAATSRYRQLVVNELLRRSTRRRHRGRRTRPEQGSWPGGDFQIARTMSWGNGGMLVNRIAPYPRIAMWTCLVCGLTNNGVRGGMKHRFPGNLQYSRRFPCRLDYQLAVLCGQVCHNDGVWWICQPVG